MAIIAVLESMNALGVRAVLSVKVALGVVADLGLMTLTQWDETDDLPDRLCTINIWVLVWCW